MSRPLLPRLSVLPVRAELARQHRTQRSLAETSGFKLNSIERFFLTGSLSWGQADRLAAALGFHPSELWGEDWWAIEAAHAAALDESRDRRRARDRDRLRAAREEKRADREWCWARLRTFLASDGCGA